MSKALELAKECGMGYLILQDGTDIDWTEELETFYQLAREDALLEAAEKAKGYLPLEFELRQMAEGEKK